MNQNYLNLNLIFLRQKLKNMLLKVSMIFPSEAFLVLITEKCYFKKHNPFDTM